MKILPILISLVLSLQIIGQPIDKALQLLKDKKLNPLKEFVVESEKINLSVHLKILRDIIPGYQEGILEIAEPKNLISCSSKIYFLSSDQTIFYYYFEKGCIKDTLGRWEAFDFLKDSFINDVGYRNFEKAFLYYYGVNIDKNDLFQTSIVYGDGCGFAGTPPEFQEKLDSLISIKDFTSIRKWLRSPNSEKQLYAIQGLIRLEKILYFMTPDDRRIINIVKQKKGMVKVCYGCLYSQDEINEVLSNIDSSLRKHKQSSTETGWTVFYGLTAGLLLLFSIRRQNKKWS